MRPFALLAAIAVASVGPQLGCGTSQTPEPPSTTVARAAAHGQVTPEQVADCYAQCARADARLVALVKPKQVAHAEAKLAARQATCAELLSRLDEGEQQQAIALAGRDYETCQTCAARCAHLIGHFAQMCPQFFPPQICDEWRPPMESACVATECPRVEALCAERCADVGATYYACCTDKLANLDFCAAGDRYVTLRCRGEVCRRACRDLCWDAYDEGVAACDGAPACLEEVRLAVRGCLAGCCAEACTADLRQALALCGEDKLCVDLAEEAGAACLAACPSP